MVLVAGVAGGPMRKSGFSSPPGFVRSKSSRSFNLKVDIEGGVKNDEANAICDENPVNPELWNLPTQVPEIQRIHDLNPEFNKNIEMYQRFRNKVSGDFVTFIVTPVGIPNPYTSTNHFLHLLQMDFLNTTRSSPGRFRRLLDLILVAVRCFLSFAFSFLG